MTEKLHSATSRNLRNHIHQTQSVLLIVTMLCLLSLTTLAQSPVVVVSAANYQAGTVAPEEIVAGFGSGLASTTLAASTVPLPTTLGGTSIKVRDSKNVERLAPLFFVSAAQINFLIPAGTASGTATLSVLNGSTVVATATIQTGDVAPGLFSADASGKGLAAASAIRVKPDGTQIWEPVGKYDTQQNKFVASPVDLTSGTDEMYLVLYGTGWRKRSDQSAVKVSIGGVNLEVIYAGSQGGFEGLDQINVKLPRTLSNGDWDIAVTVDTLAANLVRLLIKAPANEAKTYLATLRPEGSANSPASGYSSLRLSADEKTASIRFTYSNLTTPQTSMHIHGPADPGQNGSILFDLDTAEKQGDGSFLWTFANVGATSVAQILQALKTGRLYINIHSSKYPSGEIRGHYGLVNGSQAFTPPTNPPALPGGNPTAQDAARFLTQATFGPKMREITDLQTRGFNTWLNEQFAKAPQSHVAYQDWARQTEPNRMFYQEDIMESWWKQAVTGDDQLRQRVVFALNEIIVVSLNSDLDSSPYALGSWLDMLNKNAFGNFRQLLEDVTLHPAMGRYLDHLQNDKEDPDTGRNPDENFAREVQQLFTIGLYKLHPDGTLVLDANGLPIQTYDQTVIKGFAKVFTGWSYGYFSKTEQNWMWPPVWNNGHQFWLVPMQLWPNHHSTASKKLLDGVTLPAGQTGEKDLKDALDLLFNHPNVGPFIARQLIQRLVTSNPSPGYVYRVAQKFDNNGSGVRGDLKAVIRAILLDYEARSADVIANQGYGKLREPIVRFAQLLRVFNYSCPCGRIPLYWMDSPEYAIGQNPLRAPSVFNYFEPGYSQPGQIASAGLRSPEFQITTETSITGISNFMRYVVFEGFKWDETKPLLPDYSSLLPLAANPTQLVDHLNLLLLSGQMSASMKTMLVNELTKISSSNAENRVKEAVHSIVTSPEYVIQK